MPIVKTKWTKRLAVTLCTMLLMCAALPVCAFADDVHIFTAYQPFMAISVRRLTLSWKPASLPTVCK